MVELSKYLLTDDFKNKLSVLAYSNVEDQIKRYSTLLTKAITVFGDGDYHFVSSCGRSEIGGNHTDHQHGHVLAACLNIDNVAAFKKNNDNVIRYLDDHFKINEVNLNDFSLNENEKNTTESLIKGIAYYIKEKGYQIGGFDALCDSNVLIGSGISSSACFEVMIVEIFNYLYCDSKIDNIQRAIIGQKAENIYFGKPCGLLDQMTISNGGFVTIDFKDINNPKVESYNFNFKDYDLLLIDTKGSHENLSPEYAAIPNEMKEVAHCLNVEYLADADKEYFFKNLNEIKEKVNNDRAILRAIHFFDEDERCLKEVKALKDNNIDELLKLIKESGKSSYMYLQNCLVNNDTKDQSLALALYLSSMVLKDRGAYRVHGGGFKGTIQAIVPKDLKDEYIKVISAVYGDNSIINVNIRPVGTTVIV